MSTTEILPRWDLAEVDFLTTDAAEVQAQIITAYESAAGRSLASGDPVRLFLLSLAEAIVQLRADVNAAAQQNLLSYAQGKYLDALGVFFGVTRNPADAAVTTLSFTLSQALGEDYTIASGTQATNGLVTFATDDDLIIAAGATSGTVAATCTATGTSGNGYLAGQIATMVSPLAYVAAVANTSETSGGADEEDDAALAERIRLAPNAFSVAGPTRAYEFHACSVSSSIIDVSVDSPTPGVVNVYPLLEGGELPGDAFLAEVEDYLSGDDIRPLTDEVHALAPTAVEYAIHVDYWIPASESSRATAIRAAVEAAVAEYRTWQGTKIGRDISPEKLLAMVIGAGASRVDSSTLAPAAFVELDATQLAVCTGVTVTYKGTKAI